jgi:hypothetical protein
MALGMDMLIKTLIKSIGIEPEPLLATLAQWLKFGESKITDFDARLRDMEASARILAEQNAQFIAFIKAMNPSLNNPPALTDETKKEETNHG